MLLNDNQFYNKKKNYLNINMLFMTERTSKSHLNNAHSIKSYATFLSSKTWFKLNGELTSTNFCEISCAIFSFVENLMKLRIYQTLLTRSMHHISLTNHIFINTSRVTY